MARVAPAAERRRAERGRADDRCRRPAAEQPARRRGRCRAFATAWTAAARRRSDEVERTETERNVRRGRRAASEFFRDADAARFAPDASVAEWTEAGSEVVLLVEAESCSPP
jgi:hypothetical protein